MADIKSILKDQIKSEKQKKKQLQTMKVGKNINLDNEFSIQNAIKKLDSGQNLVKMETIDSVSSKNMDENPDNINIELKVDKKGEDSQLINKSSVEELINGQIQTPKLRYQNRQEIFQQIIEEERKQQGSIVIQFGNQLQIQPKFMKIRGSMCSTELWSMKQKKELCCEYIVSSQLEKGITVKTSTLSSKGLILNGFSKSSPFELNQFLDSRKYKMPKSDRLYGVSYFKPEKMINQADLQMQLEQEKLGMHVKRYSIAESISNQLNTRMPIDLKFRSKSGDEAYQKSTTSSTNKFIKRNQINCFNSPSIRSFKSDNSPLYSPLSTTYQSTFSSQIQTMSAQQLTKDSLFKQNKVKQQSFSDKMRNKYKNHKQNRSTNSVHFSSQDIGSHPILSPRINSDFFSEKGLPQTNRIAAGKQNSCSQSCFSSYILSPRDKTLGFKSSDQIEIFPSSSDFYNKSKRDFKDKEQVKNQVNSLINACNSSLLDNHIFHRQLNQSKQEVIEEAEKYAKKIQRKENSLFYQF